jgi:hypothetical protein
MADRSSGLDIAPETVVAIADAVADRLVDRLMGTDPVAIAPGGWIDAKSLARIVGRSPGWVRENADLLGGRRLGEGPKAPYVFNVDEALDGLPSCQANRRSPEPPSGNSKPDRAAPKPAEVGTSADLLPIRGA